MPASRQASEIKVTGDREVAKVLEELGQTHGKSVERRLARAALAGGLTPLTSAIRKAAPPRTRIRKSIGRRNKKNKRRGEHEAKAGVNVGNKHGVAPHGVFYTLGTKDRQTKAGGFRGRVLGSDFVAQATKESRIRVQQAMLFRIRQRLPVVIAAVAKKHSSGVNQPGVPF